MEWRIQETIPRGQNRVHATGEKTKAEFGTHGPLSRSRSSPSGVTSPASTTLPSTRCNPPESWLGWSAKGDGSLVAGNPRFCGPGRPLSPLLGAQVGNSVPVGRPDR